MNYTTRRYLRDLIGETKTVFAIVFKILTNETFRKVSTKCEIPQCHQTSRLRLISGNSSS